MKTFEVLLSEERQRSARYFDRMTTSASQLADIRKALDVSGRSQKVTMGRIAVLNIVMKRFLDDATKRLREQKWAEEAHRKMFL